MLSVVRLLFLNAGDNFISITIMYISRVSAAAGRAMERHMGSFEGDVAYDRCREQNRESSLASWVDATSRFNHEKDMMPRMPSSHTNDRLMA